MAIIIQTTFDDTNFPTRRATDEHWDQATDGLTDAAVGQTGDGISGNLDSYVSGTGEGDKILAAANYSGGGGGKGFRHFVGSGVNNNGGGLFFSFTGQTEIWVRVHVRWQSGFKWTGSQGYMKCLYWNYDQGSAGGKCYFGIHEGRWGGSVDADTVARNTPTPDIAGTLMSSTNGVRDLLTWQDTMGGEGADGNWHCLEWHMKMNTTTTEPADGVCEMWVDEGLEFSYNNVRWASTLPATFSNFKLGENASTVADPGGAAWTVDYDDVVVSTDGYIGPASGSAPFTPYTSFIRELAP